MTEQEEHIREIVRATHETRPAFEKLAASMAVVAKSLPRTNRWLRRVAAKRPGRANV